MGELLRHSIDGDLTINQKRTAAWDMWSGNHMGHIEEALHKICAKNREKKHDKG
jgi:hypothetical protein